MKHSSYWSRDMRTGDKRNSSWVLLVKKCHQDKLQYLTIDFGAVAREFKPIGNSGNITHREPDRRTHPCPPIIDWWPDRVSISRAQSSSLFTSCSAKITGQGRTTFSSSHAASHKPREDEKKTCVYRYFGAQEVVAATDSVAL